MPVIRNAMPLSRKTAPLLGLATLTALSLASFSLSALPAAAQTTVFSTFGPGNSFNQGVAYTVAGPMSGPGATGAISIGVPFSPTASGSLSSVTVAYSHVTGTDDAHLYLTNSFSNLGNTAASLESFVFTPPQFPSSAVLVLPSALHPTLTAGQTYYLYDLEPGNEVDAWYNGNPPVSGTVVQSTGGSYTPFSNQTLPAFSIQEVNPAVSVVPESSGLANMSAALLALGMGGLMMAVRRRWAKSSA